MTRRDAPATATPQSAGPRDYRSRPGPEMWGAGVHRGPVFSRISHPRIPLVRTRILSEDEPAEQRQARFLSSSSSPWSDEPAAHCFLYLCKGARRQEVMRGVLTAGRQTWETLGQALTDGGCACRSG